MIITSIVFWVCLLTLVIYFLGSLSLSVKIVGIRTKKMAATYSVYNLFFLLMRIANTLQAPMLSKTVETSIIAGEGPQLEVFYLVILMSTLGSIAGALLIPTTHRFMTSAVEKAHLQNSILSIFYKAKPLMVYSHFIKSAKWPSHKNFHRLLNFENLPIRIISMNILVSCIQTVSVLSCLYAGYHNPSLRSTCLSLNGFILGISTLLSLLITEPHISILADKVAFQGADEGYFRRYLGLVIVARVLGTALSIFFLVPISHIVVFLAQRVF